MNIQDKPALLLIDVQKGMDDLAYWGGHRNNPDAEENMARLLHFWREHDMPIFHIKHNSTNPNSRLVAGQPGNDIKDIVQPIGDEPVIEKNVNSAFIGTDLQQRLDDAGIKTLVIVGLTTDHCVSTTTRMAGNLGYTSFLIADATATFDKIGPNGKKYTAEMIHEAELASLHGEFATVVETGALIKRLFISTREKSQIEHEVFMKQTYANWSLEQKLKYWESTLLFQDKMQTQVTEGIGNFGLYILNKHTKRHLIKYEKNWDEFVNEYCKHFSINTEVGKRLCELDSNENEWIELAKQVGYNKD